MIGPHSMAHDLNNTLDTRAAALLAAANYCATDPESAPSDVLRIADQFNRYLTTGKTA